MPLHKTINSRFVLWAGLNIIELFQSKCHISEGEGHYWTKVDDLLLLKFSS